jgi:hypothetical protein
MTEPVSHIIMTGTEFGLLLLWGVFAVLFIAAAVPLAWSFWVDRHDIIERRRASRQHYRDFRARQQAARRG